MTLVLIVALAIGIAPGFREETVRFPSGGVTLAGTLAKPVGAKRPLPALVLLHGSEPGRRDGAFFRLVRDRACREGFAVLSYDKRGVGGSGGKYVETPDLRVPAGDAAAAVRHLAGRADIDRRRIGVLGISQGGWAAPLASTLSPDVAFVVAISEPGASPAEQSAFQRANELGEAGLDAATADSLTSLRILLYRYWHGDVSRAVASSRWAASRGRPWLTRAAEAADELFSRIADLPSLPPPEGMPDDFMRAIHEHFFYDPIAVAERVRVPILHLYGAKDRHLRVSESVKALRAAYARGRNANATFKVFPGAGHGMQAVSAAAECLRCPRGAEPRRPAPGWLDTLAVWLDARR